MNTIKIGRNDPCHCGSGMKYKKCCISNTNATMTMEKQNHSLSEILEMLRLTLQNLHLMNSNIKPVNVKEVAVMNNKTIECKFYTEATSSVDIKVEMTTIISGMYGFFIDDVFTNANFTQYVARAYDSSDNERMHVITPRHIAKLAAEGNPLDWMKGSIFQENTLDYRLGIAKRQISEIENGLRTVISDRLFNAYGSDWFYTNVSRDPRKNAKDGYKRKFGIETDDGSLLIEYTYLRDIKSIIVRNWSDFSDLFLDLNQFQDNMDELNKIRVEEGHNRNVTENDLENLKGLYEFFLLQITQVYSGIVPEFLVDNWKTQLKEIMFYQPELPYSDDDVQTEKIPHIKLMMTRENLECLTDYLKDKETRLRSVVVPVQKRKVHDELVGIMEGYRLANEELLEASFGMVAEEVEEKNKNVESYRSKIQEFINNYVIQES